MQKANTFAYVTILVDTSRIELLKHSFYRFHSAEFQTVFQKTNKLRSWLTGRWDRYVVPSHTESVHRIKTISSSLYIVWTQNELVMPRGARWLRPWLELGMSHVTTPSRLRLGVLYKFSQPVKCHTPGWIRRDHRYSIVYELRIRT